MSDLPSIQAIASSNDNNTTLPLIVAKRWDFPLAFIETDEGVFYAVQDWIAGLIGSQDVRKVWNDIQRKSNIRQICITKLLPYRTTDGKIYQMAYGNENTLLIIVDFLRTTTRRPQLTQIRNFISDEFPSFAHLRRDGKLKDNPLLEKKFQSLVIATLEEQGIYSNIQPLFVLPSGRIIDILTMDLNQTNCLIIECKIDVSNHYFYQAIGQLMCYQAELHRTNLIFQTISLMIASNKPLSGKDHLALNNLGIEFWFLPSKL